MSQSQQETTEATLDAAPERKSGRAVFDQGRTVWEWQTATGVFERYVSDEQLTRLEASDLRLVEQPAQNAGCAIYGSRHGVRKESVVRERVFSSSSRPASAAAGPSLGALRQFWRRLVLSA